MSSSGYFKREALVGKSVVSRNAEIIGTVLDLAVSGDGRLAIQVQKKGGSSTDGSSDMFIGAEDIQAVGDVVLLKNAYGDSPSAPVVSTPPATVQTTPVPPPPMPGLSASSIGKTCQKCGYVNSANAKFCIKCGNSLLGSP